MHGNRSGCLEPGVKRSFHGHHTVIMVHSAAVMDMHVDTAA